jgi:hypothetical protein
LRKSLLLSVGLVAALSGPALAQDGPEIPNPITMGKGPKDGERVPAWIFYWLLGIGTAVTLGLLAALKVLWAKVDEAEIPGLTEDERVMLKGLHDLVGTKNEDGVPRIYTPRTLPAEIARLTELAQGAIDKLEKMGDAKEDRTVMRTAFESEKAQMRELYTGEIKGLQTQLHQEQKERREETQQLWNKNDGTTREVMTVIRDMIVALENASKVIDKWNESQE